MRNRSWKVSVIKRLIVSFVCILAPIYILGIFTYNSGLTILRQEITESMTSQVSFYLEGLENEIERIRTQQYELINDKDINRMATIPQAMTNIETMDSLLRIRSRLSAIKNSSEYIDSAIVMLPAAGKKVTSQVVTDFSQEEFNKMKSSPFITDDNIVYVDGAMYLNISYPQWHQTNREPIFVISIKLSKENFVNALNAMRNNPMEGVALVDTKIGHTISTDTDTSFHSEIMDLIHKGSPDITEHAEFAIIHGNRYLVVYKNSTYIDSLLYKYVPEESVFRSLSGVKIWFLIFTLTALVVIVVYSYYLYNFIHKPVSRLAESFQRVKTGDFQIHIEHDHDDEFRFIYSHFNSMVKELENLIEQAYKQKMLVQRAEMKQLQSQINPHFLYNSFFILNTMSRLEDYENLEKFTEQLGKYFQFVTRSAADEVTLLKEVDHARVYTEIQAMRFYNRIKVRFDELPREYSDIVVPRLILQPLIENAFEHGLVKTTDGLLTISFEQLAQQQLHIIVENNGDEIDNEKMEILQSKITPGKNKGGEITALDNIDQRLKLKFGGEYGIRIEKGSDGGIRVILVIPVNDNRN